MKSYILELWKNSCNDNHILDLVFCSVYIIAFRHEISGGRLIFLFTLFFLFSFPSSYYSFPSLSSLSLLLIFLSCFFIYPSSTLSCSLSSTSHFPFFLFHLYFLYFPFSYPSFSPFHLLVFINYSFFPTPQSLSTSSSALWQRVISGRLQMFRRKQLPPSSLWT